MTELERAISTIQKLASQRTEASSGAAPGCAQEALLTLKEFNGLRNDTDAYLYQITLWGLGVIPIKPKKEDYGL
jgi:hypothetical protein